MHTLPLKYNATICSNNIRQYTHVDLQGLNTISCLMLLNHQTISVDLACTNRYIHTLWLVYMCIYNIHPDTIGKNIHTHIFTHKYTHFIAVVSTFTSKLRYCLFQSPLGISFIINDQPHSWVYNLIY